MPLIFAEAVASDGGGSSLLLWVAVITGGAGIVVGLIGFVSAKSAARIAAEPQAWAAKWGGIGKLAEQQDAFIEQLRESNVALEADKKALREQRHREAGEWQTEKVAFEERIDRLEQEHRGCQAQNEALRREVEELKAEIRRRPSERTRRDDPHTEEMP